jgi:nucleoside-diphosphate-sugar epimerase
MTIAFIAGAAGFLGSNLAQELLSRNYKVYGLDNFATSSRRNLEVLQKHPNFVFLQNSIVGEPRIEVTEKLDFIYHFASPASPPKYQALGLETVWANTVGTENLIKLALEHSARFLFASTSEIYGDPLVSPQKESYWGNVNTIGPRSVYDESKRLGETIVHHYVSHSNLDGAIVRIFNTYGPGMDANDGRAVTNLIRQAVTGSPFTIYGDGKQTRSFCFVDDLVRGAILVAESSKFGPYNLGSPLESTVLELAKEVATVLRVPLNLEFLDLPGDDPRRRCPDITAAKADFSWEPKVSLEVGIAKTADWIRNEYVKLGFVVS